MTPVENFLKINLICPDTNKLLFRIQKHVHMRRLIEMFYRREDIDEDTAIIFYYRGRRIRPDDTPNSLKLSDGDTIKAFIPDFEFTDNGHDAFLMNL